MGVTIYDIAEDTGLSVCTISKYLNQKKISEKNARIIRESIDQLHYVPNKAAQSLRASRSYVTALVLPQISDQLWGSFCMAVTDYLQENGYMTLIISSSQENFSTASGQSSSLLNQVDGIIMIAQDDSNLTFLESLKDRHIPVVYVDQKVEWPESDLITSTNFQSVYDSTCRLLEAGHRRLCFMSGSLKYYTFAERFRGFREACEAYHIPKSDQIFLQFDLAGDSLSKAAADFLKLPNRPTALVMGLICQPLLPQLTESGVCVPEELSIVTFDDFLMLEAIRPSISAMKQDMESIGKEAAKMLLRRMQGDTEGFPQTVYVPTIFVDRHSIDRGSYVR